MACSLRGSAAMVEPVRSRVGTLILAQRNFTIDHDGLVAMSTRIPPSSNILLSNYFQSERFRECPNRIKTANMSSAISLECGILVF